MTLGEFEWYHNAGILSFFLKMSLFLIHLFILLSPNKLSWPLTQFEYIYFSKKNVSKSETFPLNVKNSTY